MQILVSSKSLFNCLNKISFYDGDFVTGINVNNGNELIIYTRQTSVSLIVEVIGDTLLYPQEGKRWDWVRDLVSRVPEQPIILNLTPLNVNVIFQY